ncbi:DUF6169 family protein [Desertivirga arenae]|uniref:DUF6169 family protein n=1 Tax=Desertivirga arenae TaxID=2810309 RepID=UPI001A972183|nr:DUF6169 family protein [Pedobacter sp. SYSU D00823]
MLNHYNWIETSEGYEFSTAHKLDFLAYFTNFYLQNPKTEQDVEVYSLGITCKQGDDFNVHRRDSLIRNTVITIVQDFFLKNNDEVVLYVCMTDDSARKRRITFGRWFRELGDQEYEKHDCREECTKEGFYSSMIVKSDNTRKNEFVESFHYTINSYFGLPDLDRTTTSSPIHTRS